MFEHLILGREQNVDSAYYIKLSCQVKGHTQDVQKFKNLDRLLFGEGAGEEDRKGKGITAGADRNVVEGTNSPFSGQYCSEKNQNFRRACV